MVSSTHSAGHRVIGFGATIGLVIAFACATAQTNKNPSPKLSAADYQNILRNPDDEEAFQAFLDKIPTVETGEATKRTYYVLDGDMRLSRNGVRAYLRQYLQDTQKPFNKTLRVGESGPELNVMTVDDVPVKWPVGQRALTYAVDRASFRSAEEYNKIVDVMPNAILAWTKACECDLTITYRPEFDSNPDLGRVTFIVEYNPNDKNFLALGFYPSDPPDQRYLYVMEPYFTNTTYDKVGMLRHELGHILGYRHAHIGGIPGCEFYEEGDQHWKSLSQYDPKSVMHYLCGNGGSVAFELSDRDKSDHRAFYAN